jgi:hypothetical protein
MDPLTLFITALGTAAGKAGMAEGSKLIRELIGLQQDQITLLKVIDVKVDALLVGPFNTGCRQLDDAMSPDREPTDRTQLLREARTSFTQALGQDPEPVRRSLAGVHLACVWLALGSPDDVKRSLREAHAEAIRAGLNKPKVSFSQYLANELTTSTSKRGRRIDDQRMVRTTELATLANAISDARVAAGDDRADCPLVLMPLKRVEVDPTGRRPTLGWNEDGVSAMKRWVQTAN